MCGKNDFWGGLLGHLGLVAKKFLDLEILYPSDWDFSGIYGLHSLQQTSILPFFKT